MKNLYLESIEELAYEVFCEYEDLDIEHKDISIIAKYEEAKELVKEFMCLNFNIVCVDGLQKPEYNWYDKEFTISLTAINDKYELWCYPSCYEDKYLYNEATITYVLDNCSSKILPFLDAVTMYEVSIGLDEEDFLDEECHCCCDECCECDEDTELTEDTHGFTVTNSDENGTFSYSFYSTDRNLVAEMLKKFK